MKEERVKKMNQIYNYCMICNKRNGSWYYDCHPSSFGAKRHGSGKELYRLGNLVAYIDDGVLFCSPKGKDEFHFMSVEDAIEKCR